MTIIKFAILGIIEDVLLSSDHHKVEMVSVETFNLSLLPSIVPWPTASELLHSFACKSLRVSYRGLRGRVSCSRGLKILRNGVI
jgi:hypothetical protein